MLSKFAIAVVGFSAVMAVLVAGSPVMPCQWTEYQQCDSQWGSTPLGSSSQNTICTAGCAMSSVSMALNSLGESINGGTIDPGTLNQWLLNNNGYADGDLIIWNSVAALGEWSMQEDVQAMDSGSLQTFVGNCQPVIANVRDGTHWVLVTGYDDSQSTVFYVNDPYFSNTYYDLSDMSNWVVYTNGSNAFVDRTAVQRTRASLK